MFQREAERNRRETAKEKLSERDDGDSTESGQEDREEQQKELPPLYIPQSPSPLCCGFYSQPGQFWLSMVHTHTQLLFTV